MLQIERLSRGEWASVRSGDERREISLVKSGSRVLEVLEYFKRAQRPARAIEIGETLKLPKSSANVLLKTLVETGYLTFDARSKCYFPSLRVLRLGNWLQPDPHGAPRFFGLMQELSQATGAGCGVSVQNGSYVQFVAIVDGPGYMPAERVEGGKIPIIGSASGGALLTVKSDAEIAAIVRMSTGHKSTQEYRAVFEQVRRQAEKFRAQGFAATFGGIDREIASIAVMLPRIVGNVPMTLGCGGESLFAYRGRENEVADVMRRIIRNHFA